MYLWTIIRGQYLWDIRNDNQWHSDFTVSFTFYSPGISMSTNLILRPDIVHSVSFSWNLITKRHKEHNGSWVMSNQWWLQREKKIQSNLLSEVISWMLTCSLSVFRLRRSLACMHSRSPLLYIRALWPPPALPAQSQEHRYHLWGSTRGVKWNTDLWL